MSTRSDRINTIVFAGVVVLVALLPFHAFLRTWLAAVFTESTVDSISPGAQILAAWKDMILIILLLLIALRSILERKLPFRITPIDGGIIALVVLAITIQLFAPLPISQWVWGLRTDFSFFALYVVARSVPITKYRAWTVIKTLVISGALVLGIGLMLKFILPHDFLLHFGYSPYVSSYVDYKPLPMYHCQYTAGDTCVPRLASTLSGPNQYGTYLLLLISLFLALVVHGRNKTEKSLFSALTGNSGFMSMVLIAAMISLYYSFSQAAWIALAGILGMFILSFVKNTRIFIRDSIIVVVIIVAALLIFKPVNMTGVMQDPSTRDHIERFRNGIEIIAENPWGLGVGSAGPVSERFYGDKKGIISESWYVQMGEELGVLGVSIFIAIVIGMLLTAWHGIKIATESPYRILALTTLLTLTGISIDAIVLHAWADTTTAWLTFVLIGCVMQLVYEKKQPTGVLKSKGVAAFSGKAY